jgi:hypothetical protein
MATGLSVAWSVLAVREPLEGRRRKGATKPRPTGGEAERRLAMQGRMRDALWLTWKYLKRRLFERQRSRYGFYPTSKKLKFELEMSCTVFRYKKLAYLHKEYLPPRALHLTSSTSDPT